MTNALNPITRDRVLIVSTLVALTALSWAYLIQLDRQMSASMADREMMARMGMAMDQPWTSRDVRFTFVMWSVMMVGMMTASAAPAVLVMARAQAHRGERRLSSTTLLFAGGYLAVWVAFSAAATLAQWGLHDAAMLSPAMAASSPRLAGAVLIVAGVYQWTPFKQACLAHCRGPLDFLMAHWRPGRRGALRMGAHHGAYCVGCCWALMALLFVVGVMNLIGVAVLAGLVLVEKATPAGAAISRIAGVGLAIAGGAIVLL